MQFVVVLLVLLLIVAFVTVPLRRDPASRDRRRRERVARAVQAVEDLEAAREAKYREIRDAELDHSTGKLSDRDFEATDGTLRAEAIEILRALDRARERVLELTESDAGGDLARRRTPAGEEPDRARSGEQLPSSRR